MSPASTVGVQREPSPCGGPTFAVQASGAPTTVSLDATMRRTTVVADFSGPKGYTGDLTLSVRPAGKGATARVEVAEAWLVGIPAAQADLVSMKPVASSAWLVTRGSVALGDGRHYGPAVALIAVAYIALTVFG